MSGQAHSTVDDAIQRVLRGYEALTELGEEIEDEWSYVQDLSAAWRARLDAVADARGDQPLDEASDAAIDVAIDEAARIEDPHRAIDWLSTFPQVALLAIGERP